MPNLPSSDDPWRACYREMAPKLVLFARQWSASLADAEDAVQAGFVKFWRQKPAAQPEDYPLLFATVRSAALDLRRGEGRRVQRELAAAAEIEEAEPPQLRFGPDCLEEAVSIESALQRLPPEQREVVVLRIWGELTFAEIAAAVGEPLNTVAARHRYALKALARVLKPYESERV